MIVGGGFVTTRLPRLVFFLYYLPEFGTDLLSTCSVRFSNDWQTGSLHWPTFSFYDRLLLVRIIIVQFQISKKRPIWQRSLSYFLVELNASSFLSNLASFLGPKSFCNLFPLFTESAPLGRFSHRVAISVQMSVCLSAPSGAVFIVASHCPDITWSVPGLALVNPPSKKK